jgi:hypothetical protein
MRATLILVPLLLLATLPLASAGPDVAVCVGSKVGVQPCPGAACVWTAAKATCVGAATVSLPEKCWGHRVGFEGYQETCVNPNDPHCLIYQYEWTGADEFSSCSGI